MNTLKKIICLLTGHATVMSYDNRRKLFCLRCGKNWIAWK